MAEPQGVRIVREDGTEVPCELVHEGVDEQGIDQWVIANAVFHVGRDRLHIDRFPGRTGLAFDVNTSKVMKVVDNPEDSVINNIDALVDESLSHGPLDDYSRNALSRLDDGVVRAERCGVCRGPWHGLANSYGCPSEFGSDDEIAAYGAMHDPKSVGGHGNPNRIQAGDPIYLGSVLHNVQFFGVVSEVDTPEQVSATLEIADNGDQTLQLRALRGPPGPVPQMIRFEGTLDSEDDLPQNLLGPDAGRLYVVGEEQVSYVWDGDAFQVLGAQSTMHPNPAERLNHMIGSMLAHLGTIFDQFDSEHMLQMVNDGLGPSADPEVYLRGLFDFR